MKSYIHHVPGRLRIANQLLKCEANQITVRKILSELNCKVEFNSTTGSMVIYYDPKEMNESSILKILEKSICYDPQDIKTNSDAICEATSKIYNIITLLI